MFHPSSIQPFPVVCFCFLTLLQLAVAGTLFVKREVCYDDPPIGCFNNDYPFDHTMSLPSSPNFINIHYEHTIHYNKARFHWRDADKVMAERFRKDLKTVVIVHGFTEKGSKLWVREMVAALARLPEAINIVVVDWTRGAKMMTFFHAFVNGRVVAAMGALFLKGLISLGASPESFHIIGNSLGAHVAAMLASRVPGTGRVTGLDPARLNYSRFPPEFRLDPTDGAVVDVIHTDGSDSWISYGSLITLGTVDFYANGGIDQPGCNDTLWTVILDLFWVNKEKCSHARSNELFTESISVCKIMAGKCASLEDIENKKCTNCADSGSCVQYGYHMSPNVTGLYAFTTGGEKPYTC